MPRKKSRNRNAPIQQPGEQIEGVTGASDATSGGGAGSGTPDAETNIRTRGRFSGGDVERDRRKLFPDAETRYVKKARPKKAGGQGHGKLG